MNRRFLLLLFWVLAAAPLSAQQSFTISGVVSDEYSGESMIGASVFEPNLRKGTTTNTYGFYSLTLPEGTYSIVYSFVGYEPFTREIELNKDLQLDVSLKGMELLEVELVEKVTTQIQETTQMSTIDLPMEAVEKLPVFMGERDILKTAQLLPGIQSGNEGTSGLFVRGGSPDQNLILLDGVPVYNANHLFGFFSVFNPDAISSVSIMKGGFPARYGGRLSSVIDVHMKEGNMREFEGDLSIGLIAAKIAVQGPIKKDTTSYMISARRTYIDALAQPVIIAVENTSAGYFFHDVNAKVNHKFNREHRLYASTYFGKDKAYNRESYGDGELFRAGLEWGNLTSALRWNWQVTDKLFSNTTLTYSNYEMAVGFQEIWTEDNERYEYEYEYSSGIRDWAIKYDLDYIPGDQHYIVDFLWSYGQGGSDSSPIWFNSTDPFLNTPYTYYDPTDPNKYFDGEAYFTDEHYSGGSYSFRVKFYADDWTAISSEGVEVRLKHVSEDYYRYKYSSLLQQWTDGDPFAQPAIVHNNVQNGIGCVGSLYPGSVLVSQ